MPVIRLLCMLKLWETQVITGDNAWTIGDRLPPDS
jgi:hypothetical protein